MDSEETLKYLQQKYPEDLNENYRCYWWYTSNIDGSALTYYLVLHDKFCETDKEPMICLRAHSSKSYRENNPGKGYWDWKVEAFADGGQTGDPEKERFYQATGRSSSGRPLEEGLNLYLVQKMLLI